MIIHKMYECEYCGEEFDDDEKELCARHEERCSSNPEQKQCASCANGKIEIHYECPSVNCSMRKSISDSCSKWKMKREG